MKKFFIRLLAKYLRKFATLEIYEMNNYLIPYKEELTKLRNFISLIGLEFYLNNRDSKFYIEVSYNKNANLVCENSSERRLFPLYSIKVYNILTNVYKIPVKYLRELEPINLSQFDKYISFRVLGDD